MKHVFTTLIAACSFFACAAQDSPLWLRYPAISPNGQSIAFTYKGDIYTVPSAGGKAQSITTNAAYDVNPVWSPDGKWIAFSSDRFGNFDIFIVPAQGGTPKRLTTNSTKETVQAFTPDGKSVVFTASLQRPAANQQFPASYLPETYAVSIDGGRIKQLTTTPAESHFFSNNGKYIYFNDIRGQEDKWRKHHTSSVARDIWRWDVPANTFAQLTTDGAEDRNPVLSADENTIFYISENAGSFNVWKMPANNTAEKTQVTFFEKDPVRFLSISKDNTLAFSQNGELYTLREGQKPQKVSVALSGDAAIDHTTSTVSRGISDAVLSPNGKEIAFVVRGDIYVTSVDYATTRKITNTPSAERTPSFSADGRTLAYAAFRNGGWSIYTAKIGKSTDPYFYAAATIDEQPLVEDADDTFQPVFAPVGNEVAYLRNRTQINIVDSKTKANRQVTNGSKNFSYADGDIAFQWSPDGKWITLAYIDKLRQGYNDIGIVSANGGEIKNITLSGYMQEEPKWLMNGDIVLFSSDRYGMRAHGSWGSLSDVMGVYTNRAAYDKSRLSEEDLALIKEQEKLKKDAEKKEKSAKETKAKGKSDKKAADQPADSSKKATKVEFNDIENRIVRLTPNSSNLADYTITPDGKKLYYLAAFEKGYDLWVTDLVKKETKILQKLNGGYASLTLDKEGKNLFVMSSREISKIDVASGSRKPVTFAADVDIDRAAERSYMFEHVYRTVKNKFYDTTLHHTDWEYYKSNYERFLPHISNDYDFAEMLSEMLGELNASHTGCRNYSTLGQQNDITARLGLLFDLNYTGEGAKVSEVIKNGPFDRESSKVKAGDILTAIDGQQIAAGEDYYPMLNHKSGKRTLLTFKNANGTAWDEVIKPISASSERALMYKRWIENRRSEVERLSNGRLGYVHIESMADPSFRSAFSDIFGRYNDKEGIIIDTRFNGGGRMHEDIEALFSGTKYLEQIPREQFTGIQPQKRWTKPSIMLIGESNYSNAHGTPWVYKKMGLGKLVGMPVPGTMTSVWWETLQDDDLVYGIPIVGYRTQEGTYLENSQLEPDIKVRNEPTVLDAGRDQQIEAAVKELLKEVDENKSKTW